MTGRISVSYVVTVIVALSPAPASLGAQVVDNVLTHPAPATMMTLERFQPELEAVDGPFECGKPEAHTANVLFPHDATVYGAYAPTRAESRASVLVFVDSAGSILRYSERRGLPIRPETRGLTPEQVGAAVQAAANEARATTISIDFIGQRATVANTGGNRPNHRVIARSDEVKHLEKLGDPVKRAELILAACRTDKR